MQDIRTDILDYCQVFFRQIHLTLYNRLSFYWYYFSYVCAIRPEDVQECDIHVF